MESKTVRHRMYDKSYTYSYRTGNSKGQPIGNHTHIYYEIVHLIEGTILYNVEGAEYEINSGDFVITNPNEFHFITFPKETLYYREFFQMDRNLIRIYKPDILDTLDVRNFGKNNKIPKETAEKYGLDEIFRGIQSYCENPVDHTDFMISLYAAQLAIKLGEIFSNEFLVNSHRLKNERAEEIYQFIEQHFSEKIGIEDIAEGLYLNKAYIGRIFKTYMGISPGMYLGIRRIMYAKNLLVQGDSISEIYEKCGFNDYVTFYRTFKKHVGMTPEKFRKNNLKPLEERE